MTKILYIPNGEFITFEDKNNHIRYTANIENISLIAYDYLDRLNTLSPITVNDILYYITDRRELKSQFSKRNKFATIVSLSELEVIYD